MESACDTATLESEFNLSVVAPLHAFKSAKRGKPFELKQMLYRFLRLCTCMAFVLIVSKLIRFREFTIPITLRSTTMGTKRKLVRRIHGWNIIGGSEEGTKHRKKKQSCQDDWNYQLLRSGELVIAVADGAGTASLSQQGAEHAVDAAVKYLCTAILKYKPSTAKEWESIVSYAFEVARAQLIDYAASQAKPLKNYNTTLQIVVAADSWTVSAIVGDGTAVGLRNDNSLLSLMSPQRGEYANATNFITSHSAMNNIAIQVLQERVTGIAVLTDGLLSLAIDGHDNTPYPKFFVPLFSFLDASTDRKQAKKALSQFLLSDRVNNRTDDDKTIVLAVRSSA
jgi:hypothetical protein